MVVGVVFVDWFGVGLVCLDDCRFACYRFGWLALYLVGVGCWVAGCRYVLVGFRFCCRGFAVQGFGYCLCGGFCGLCVLCWFVGRAAYWFGWACYVGGVWVFVLDLWWHDSWFGFLELIMVRWVGWLQWFWFGCFVIARLVTLGCVGVYVLLLFW